MDEELDPGPVVRNQRHRGRALRRPTQRPNIAARSNNNVALRTNPAPHNQNPRRGRGGRGHQFMNMDNGQRGRSAAQRASHVNLQNNYENNKSDQRNQSENSNRGQGRKKHIGFRRLEEIAQSESQDALAKIIECKDSFIDIIQSPIEKYDVFVLVIKCLERVCESSFDELKLKLLIDTCNSQFIASLNMYLMELPYVQAQAKAANNMYWRDQDAFWKSLIFFCESLIITSPSLAMNKCRSLIEGTSAVCLDGLTQRHSYNLPNELQVKLTELRERMNNYEIMRQQTKKTLRHQVPFEDEDPPDNFRELSLTPTKEDLLHQKPFVRPNIVDGAYKDVEHYLDVQFRLLREDCFGPLREGLYQYIKDNKRRKFDHIRVIHNVRFVRPYVSQTKVGSMVQIDMKTNKGFKKINWNYSKRFIYGGLVLFTKDNCKSFLVGTILDRIPKYLIEGMIPISLVGMDFDEGLYNNLDTYTMIESEVYFEPYFHVLKALQDPTFPEHLAMQQYIVEVKAESKPPSYLSLDTKYEITELDQTENINNDANKKIIKYTVLQDHTWPEKDVFKFNDSQLEAYKLALTHELAVIQGPPGTGKTYLGIKVAEALLNNVQNDVDGCLLLIICYTNHALDQFLEALLKSTNSIVRIGGQSRNEMMEAINLTKLRNSVNSRCPAYEVFRDEKSDLKRLVWAFQQANAELDVLVNGVLRSEVLCDDVPEVEHLIKFYNVPKVEEDVLSQWLFAYTDRYYVDDDTALLEESATAQNAFVDLEKEARKRIDVELDDRRNEEIELHQTHMAAFYMEENNSELRRLISEYNACTKVAKKRNIRFQFQYLNARKELYKDMSQYRDRRIDPRITPDTNFNRFSLEDRWSLYFTWIEVQVREKKRQIGELQAQLDAAMTAYEEARMLLDMQLLRKKKVVGMTTSGAARLRKLLQTLAPPIVIVEEAAEVLEQHIITSLTKNCSHLILIGDHQQLRPSAAHVKLAREYGIEVSLFERLIANGIHSRRLRVQHRMRPEIAALVAPHIYPDLQNHRSVYDFPDVRGMLCNLFFFTHDHKEQEELENMGRKNSEEGNLVLALANYIMQQGYNPEDVTILAAYKGQMFYLKKESEKYIHLKGVKITVVDNYQGEESKIIILSLVRNNADNRIGFLGTSNRICVALSRAREGFYIFGNIEILKANSDLWKNIATTFENSNSLGRSITLKCQNHPHSLTTIKEVKDFEQVPEGGCRLLCDSEQACGHRCPLVCHGYDRGHNSFFTRCLRNCERILCDLNHICPKQCFEACGPCKRKVKKTLPCGHDMDIPCYQEPDDPCIKCKTLVEFTLRDCGHKVEAMCHTKGEIICPVKCEYRVDKCGHSCTLQCHVKNDPDHEKYVCKKPCARVKAGCSSEAADDRSHQCDKLCWETCDPCLVQVKKRRSTCTHTDLISCNKNIDETKCLKNCSRKLPCGHSCKQKCSKVCGDCTVRVEKEIPECKHKIKIECRFTPIREYCTFNCDRTMGCGHKCKGLCRDPCDPSHCTDPSTRTVQSPCGHRVTVPCNLAEQPTEWTQARMVSWCAAACGVELSCGHACAGSCGRCRAGRLHAPCASVCRRPNICGHLCEEPCSQVCPPCKKQCEVRCEHARCKQLCGAPCTPCKEECGRACRHGRCARRCGQECARAACGLACPRTLACGHACRGLCGEPCPPVCRQCRPDTFPTDFLGYEFDVDARFVLLQDCGHVLEVEDMDNLMTSDTEQVQIRQCPFCRKPIINTLRYKDLVNKTFRQEINVIKRRVYGTPKEIADKRKELEEKITGFKQDYSRVLCADKNIDRIYHNIQDVSKTSKTLSKMHLNMMLTCLNIIDMMAECYKKYLDANLIALKTELQDQTKFMCSAFTLKVKSGVMLKVSEQQQKDLRLEMKRMNSIVQLAKLVQHPCFIKEKVRTEYQSATDIVFREYVFNEMMAMEALEKLQKAVKVTGLVTKQERDLVVKAIGLKAGHWYKCPNGHFYCIGECGGAMQVSHCIECGAQIGGTRHTLLAGNAHAPELDGSRFAAWSNEYNNMANFVF